MSGSYGVFAGVTATPYTIGYISLSYIIPSNSPYALIRNADGNFVTAGTTEMKEIPSQNVFSISFIGSVNKKN